MKAVGLDVGHSAIKVAFSKDGLVRTALVPSAVSPAFAIYDEVGARRAAANTFQVNGKKFFVGETAITQGGVRALNGLYEDWIHTDTHDALLLAGQAQVVAGGGEKDALYVLGLPGGLFDRQRDSLRERASRVLQAEVVVMPQPFGPYSLHIVDDRGVLKSAHAAENESWAVIEVGFFTTDYTVIDRGEWIQEKTASTKGVSSAANRLTRALSKEGINASMLECEKILATGVMMDGPNAVPKTELVKEALEPLQMQIVDQANVLFGEYGRRLTGIIVTGGGCSYVSELLAKQWKRVVTPENPRFSVAEGMRRHGELKIRAKLNPELAE